MAYQVGFICYPTTLAAAQAAASASVGSVVNHGGAAYVVGVDSVTVTTINYSFEPVAGGSPISLSVPFDAQPCNLLTMDDGIHIAWLLIAAWASTYAVMHIAKALRGETGGGYGDA